ncbi:MAG: amidase [Alphaproteobacteria bacterium]|nr:amidase [Alphaproteobacteria bacterium]
MARAPNELTATEAAAEIAAGRLTAEALARACLERIAQREAVVHAFAHADPERALAEARARDRARDKGPLHGIPFGVKDIIDTHDMPTTCGSPIYQGHRPPSDASCVALAREAGAVMLGKTVTTEFASRNPGPTANPHNPAHTPGGSSSGSAAAVADFMVPVAFGTQTGGSIIRPASYCGVVGYKPSYGTLNPTGVKPLATSFDTVGVMARSVDDCALAVAVLAGDAPDRRAVHATKPARVGLLRGPDWSAAGADMARALEMAAGQVGRAGARVEEIVLPVLFDAFGETQSMVLRFEAARIFADERTRHPDKLSALMREEIGGGLATSRRQYLEGLALLRRCRATLAEMMQGIDVVLCASAPGEAPRGLGSTGGATFNRLQSGTGLPSLTLPGFVGANKLPVGVQAMGAAGEDYRLLCYAKWIGERIGEGR